MTPSPRAAAAAQTSLSVSLRSCSASATVVQTPVMISMHDSSSSCLAFGCSPPCGAPSSARISLAIGPRASSRVSRSTSSSSHSTPRLERGEELNGICTPGTLPAVTARSRCRERAQTSADVHSESASARRDSPCFCGPMTGRTTPSRAQPVVMPRARWKRSTSSKLRPAPNSREPVPTTTAPMAISSTSTTTRLRQRNRANESNHATLCCHAVTDGISSERGDGRIAPPDLTQRVTHLANRRPCGESGPHRVEHVVARCRGGLGNATHLVERAAHVVRGALGTQRRQPLRLLLLDRGIDPQGLVALVLSGHILVHADDDALARLDLLSVGVGGLFDLVLLESVLDGGDSSAEILDPHHERQRLLLDLVGHGLDGVGPREGVDGRGQVGFVRQHLLGAYGEAGRLLRRQCDRLVEGIGV